jgi:tetratricopeptide (TPR) repeat protein
MVLKNALRQPQVKCFLMRCAFAPVLVCMGVQTAWSQTTNTHSQDGAALLRAHIAHEVDWVHHSAELHLTRAQTGILWGRIASGYQDEAEIAAAADAYDRSLELLRTEPAARADYATVLDNLGSLYLETGRPNEAENYGNEALRVREALGDQLAIASSQHHLAEVFLVKRRFGDAEKEASMALEAQAAADDPDAGDRVGALLTRTYARCFSGKCAEGLQDAEQAMAIARTGFQPDSVPAAHIWLALGLAQWKTGAVEDADTSMRRGIEILRTRMSPADPLLLGALTQYSTYLEAVHRKPEARRVEEEVARENRQSEPCTTCTVSIYGLANGGSANGFRQANR